MIMKRRGVRRALENARSVIVQMILTLVTKLNIMHTEDRESRDYPGFCFGREAGMTLSK